MKKILSVVIIAISILNFSFLNHFIVLAASSPWSQTNWVGGSGQADWADATKFNTSSTVTSSTANQVTLSLEKFSNTDFETNLDNWSAGVNPESITGMKLWLKADAITGLSDGDAVSTWEDASGLDHDATQATAGRRPTYETNILNGKPVIRFNGTSQGMYVPHTTDLDATSGFSVFIVTTARTSGADQVIVYKGDHDSGTGYNYRIIHWTDGQKYGGLNGSGGELFYAFGATNVNTPEILSSYWNGTNLFAYVNGTQTGNASANTTGTTFINDFQIAYDNVHNEDFLNGDIAEIIVYNSIITNTQRQQVEAYLQAKYAISSGYGTVTRDTSTTYDSSVGSTKVVVGGNDTDFIQSVNVGSTDTYNLGAYAYTDGSAVTSSDAQLFYNGSTVSTTYTDAGSGWYKLSGTITGAASSRDYGVRVKANKTVYLDNVSLRVNGTVSGTLTSSIFDSEYDNGATWGTLTFSVTAPTNTTATVKVRTGNEADLSDATAFSSCSVISSGSTVSSNDCVINSDRYAQYQIALSTTDTAATPTFSSFSLAFSEYVEPTPTPTPTPTSTSSSSSSTSSNTNSSPQTCSAQSPSNAPDLFQVSTSPNTATLYFTPVNPATGYTVSYGTNAEANQHAVSFDYSNGSGAIAYTINSLTQATTYHFKVQAKNGCATGNWSSVVSSTTVGQGASTNFISNIVDTARETLNPPKELEIVSSELTAKKSNVCSYTIKSGDSLWTIAQANLGQGALFADIKELNNLTSNTLSVGQELKLPCDATDETIEKAKEEVTRSGVSLDVKVVSMKNEPVEGATVTLHSKVQVAKTDKDGVARFEDVESGEHKVFIAYNDYTGEQALTIDGSKKEQTLSLQIQLNSGVPTPVVLSVVGVMGAVIAFLIVALYRKKLLFARHGHD